MAPVFSKPTVNERPTARAQCSKCEQPHLGPLLLCEAGGKHLQNWGRWFQKCMNPSCGEFYWHNAETPLSDIPFDVQLNFTLRASSVEAPDISGLSCPQCRTRRANKGCQRSPPHCSTCCKAAGGCRIHKVTSGNQPSSLMGPPNEETAASVYAADSQPPAPIPHVPLRTSYARPLDEKYGKVYLDVHRRLQEQTRDLEMQRQITITLNNSVSIVLWNKLNEGPKRFNVSCTQPGKLLPASLPLITGALPDDCFISVLSASPRTEWIVQELSMPISVTAGVRVLLRVSSLEDHECMGLQNEVNAVISETKGSLIHRAHAISLPLAAKSSPHSGLQEYTEKTLNALTPSDSVQTIDTICHPNRRVIPIPFPLTFVCEMATGMLAMKDLDTDKELRENFKRYFPRCDYNKSTFYKHRAIYRKATSSGVLPRYVQYGRCDAGRWSHLVKEVNKSAGITTTAAKHELLSPELDDDADTSTFTIWSITLESFVYVDGVLQSRGTGIETDALIGEQPVAIGHCKQVQMVHCQYEAAERAFVLKEICLPGQWWLPCPSKTFSIWLEASRLARCYFAEKAFNARALLAGARIEAFEVLPSFLFIRNEWSALGQPCIFGARFTSEGLVESLAKDTFNAFSHFSVDFSSGTLVHTEFEGFRTLQGLRVFDCASHSNLTDTNDHFYIGNRGIIGVDDFKTQHICNSVCKSLGLSSFT